VAFLVEGIDDLVRQLAERGVEFVLPEAASFENKVEQVARQRGGAPRAPRYATCIKSSLNSWSCDLEDTDTREDDGMRRFHTTARYVNGRIVVGTLRAY
jgi:hypothetical protein